MKICEYGCGREAEYKFKNGKWCCESNAKRCPEQRRLVSIKSKNPTEETRLKMSLSLSGEKNPMFGKKHLEETKRKISLKCKNPSKKTREKLRNSRLGKISPMKGKKHTPEAKLKIRKARNIQPPPMKGRFHRSSTKRKISLKNTGRKKSLKFYKKKYPLLLKVDEIKENLNGDIIVHCKNSNCSNSKENGGWFVPSTLQLNHRIRAIYHPEGFGESNFYCSDHCKEECILFNLRGDPLKNMEKLYIEEEYKIFRNYVLGRDKHECQYCGKPATEIHHERPQKLEPFFVLDPDYSWSCCKKCHSKKAHKKGTDCSTGNLANKICLEKAV